MRLTADVLLRAENYINAVQLREINLRGYKIPAIENLAIIQGQFDVIDLSDNEIKKLDNFPTMSRVSCILLNNNSISRIGSDIGDRLTALSHLVLTNNRITKLVELNHISKLKRLEHLSLLENPVTAESGYRLYVIFLMPKLKSLDFRKINQKEREGAIKYFKSGPGRELAGQLLGEEQMSLLELAAEQANPVAKVEEDAQDNVMASLNEEQRAEVYHAIEQADSPEEVDRIEQTIKLGTFVFKGSKGLSDDSSDIQNESKKLKTK